MLRQKLAVVSTSGADNRGRGTQSWPLTVTFVWTRWVTASDQLTVTKLYSIVLVESFQFDADS